MTKVKMTVPYRKSALILVMGIGLILALLGIGILAAVEGIGIFTALFCAIDLLVVAGLWFRFHYGLTVTEKWVTFIEQSEIKRIPYSEVRRIVVIFSEESVTAIVKAARGKAYTVVWSDLFLGGAFFTQNRILITPRFVEKTIRALSQCEKITVRSDLEELRK